jgi:hypothetical protein
VWLSAVPASAQIPDCLVVEARAAPSGNGAYDHYLTFINECDVRMHLTARYSDAPPGSIAGRETVPVGERVTITLGLSRPNQAFSAHYDVRFGGRRSERSRDKPATGTLRSAAARSQATPGSRGSSAARSGRLPIVELCDRAVRNIFKVQGLPDDDSQLKARVANCPSRVSRDPQRRRAELECVLRATTSEDVRTCFAAK